MASSWLWTKGVLLCQALFLLTGAVTVGSALLLVPEPHRGGRFFLSLMALVFAEAATFGWVALVTTGRGRTGTSSAAGRGFFKFVLLYDALVVGLVYVALHQLVNNTILVILHAVAGLLFALAFGLFTLTQLRGQALRAEVTAHAVAVRDLTRTAAQAVELLQRAQPAAAWAGALRAVRGLEEDLRYAATGTGGEALEKQLDRGLAELARRLGKEPAASHAPEIEAQIAELRSLVKQREGLVGR